MEESEEEGEVVVGGVWGDVANDDVVHGAGASAVEVAHALECGGRGRVDFHDDGAVLGVVGFGGFEGGEGEEEEGCEEEEEAYRKCGLGFGEKGIV